MSVDSTLAAPVVDHAAQRRKQAWHPLHFIQNQQSLRMLLQKQFDVLHLAGILRTFQVAVHGTKFVSQRARQRGLADLPGPYKYDNRAAAQERLQLVREVWATYHC